MNRISLLLAALVLVVAQALANETSTIRRFESARRSEPQLVAFLKQMPKGADLHHHAAGAVYAETYLDAALKSDLFFNPETLSFADAQAPGFVPGREILTHTGWADRFLEMASMRGIEHSGKSGRDHFFNSFGVFGPLGEATGPDVGLAEVMSRARLQNIQYLELMTWVLPKPALAAAVRNPPEVGDLEKAWEMMQPRFPALLAATKAYLDERDRKVAELLGAAGPITSGDGPVIVRYIFGVTRTQPNPAFFAQMACGMAIAQHDRRVAGLTIVAPEDDLNSRRNFEMQMKMTDFLWNRMDKPNMTLHAGELTLEYSPVEVMRSRIRKTIEIGHANRIGHGVSVAWEDDLPGLWREMKDRRVAVEICLTSNDAILKVSGDRHPFLLYREAGILMTLNTDDEGINRSNLTMEFVRAVRAYNLSYPDLKDLARNSLEYSFLPGESLYHAGNYKKIRPEFAGLRKRQWKPEETARAAMSESEKLSQQVRLERAFVEFEK